MNPDESLTLGCSLSEANSSYNNNDSASHCNFYSTQTSLNIVAYYGMLMYLTYCGIVILGLLNIFIAMMTNTYAAVYVSTLI